MNSTAHMLGLSYNPKNVLLIISNPENPLDKIHFEVQSIIPKKTEDGNSGEYQLNLLNAFINFKGTEFKIDLFRRYREAYELLEGMIIIPSVTPLPTKIIHNILEVFNLQEIEEFLVKVYGLRAPSTLLNEFTTTQKDVSGYNKSQTYIKQEYIELMCFIVKIKAVLGPIGYFAVIKQNYLNSKLKEYILFNFISTSTLVKTKPFIKLEGLATALMETGAIDKTAESIRVIENSIPKEETKNYILSLIIIQRLLSVNVNEDDDQKHLINVLFSFINSKLKPNNDVTKSIRPKLLSVAMDGDNVDTESTLEACRVGTTHPLSTPIKYNWAISDYDLIKRDFSNNGYCNFDNNGRGVYISHELLEDNSNSAKEFLNTKSIIRINDTHLTLCGIIFKTIVDPRGMDLIKIENLYNLIVIGSSYCQALGFKTLSRLLLGYVENTTEDLFNLSTSPNRSRITPALKDQINDLFPLGRNINNDSVVNIVEEMINNISNTILNQNWRTLQNRKYLDGLSSNNFLPLDFKIELSEFIVKHEKLRLGV